MQQEDWKFKYEDFKRNHNSVARQWLRTYDQQFSELLQEREERNVVVQTYEKQIADLKQEKQQLLLKLEKAHASEFQSEQDRLSIACELACYKLRNMR